MGEAKRTTRSKQKTTAVVLKTKGKKKGQPKLKKANPKKFINKSFKKAKKVKKEVKKGAKELKKGVPDLMKAKKYLEVAVAKAQGKKGKTKGPIVPPSKHSKGKKMK